MTIAGQGEGNLTGSFAGLRVLDFSTTIAGPHCTRMLADTGAEVIKVETSEGETMRTRPPLRNHCSTAFGQLNVGKNSVVLDLKSPAGVEAVRGLVANADVLVENFPPRRDEAAEARSRIGARAQPETDLLLDLRLRADRAVVGTAGLCAGDPCRFRLRHGASRLPAGPRAARLLRHLPCRCHHRRLRVRRHRRGAVSAPGTGKGQHIDVSMLESMLTLTVNEVQWAQFEVQPTAAADVRADRDLRRLYHGRHGQREDVPEPVQVIGHPEWISDPRFAKYPDRRENWAKLMEASKPGRARSNRAMPRCANTEGVPSSAYRTVKKRRSPIRRSPIAARWPR